MIKNMANKIQTTGRYIVMLVFSLVIVVCGCCDIKSSPRINAEDVENISFSFLPKGMDTQVDYTCDDVINDNLRIDTVIINRSFIKKYVAKLNGLYKDENPHSMDMRIVSIVNYTDGTHSVVGFGELWGILVDNVAMHDDENILNFIDENVYTKEQMRKFYQIDFVNFGQKDFTTTDTFEQYFNQAYENYLKGNVQENVDLFNHIIDSLLSKKNE